MSTVENSGAPAGLRQRRQDDLGMDTLGPDQQYLGAATSQPVELAIQRVGIYGWRK
jgi:hypothetical protein